MLSILEHLTRILICLISEPGGDGFFLGQQGEGFGNTVSKQIVLTAPVIITRKNSQSRARPNTFWSVPVQISPGQTKMSSTHICHLLSGGRLRRGRAGVLSPNLAKGVASVLGCCVSCSDLNHKVLWINAERSVVDSKRADSLLRI